MRDLLSTDQHSLVTHASSFIATVTAGIYTAATGLASAITAMSAQKRKLQKSIKSITSRISRRTVAGAVRNVGTTFGEAIPYVGVAVIVGVTSLELNDAGNTVKDLDQLEKELNIKDVSDNEVSMVCGLEVPTREEVWAKAKDSPKQVWRAAMESLNELPSFEFPSVNGSLDRIYDSIGVHLAAVCALNRSLNAGAGSLRFEFKLFSLNAFLSFLSLEDTLGQRRP